MVAKYLVPLVTLSILATILKSAHSSPIKPLESNEPPPLRNSYSVPTATSGELPSSNFRVLGSSHSVNYPGSRSNLHEDTQLVNGPTANTGHESNVRPIPRQDSFNNPANSLHAPMQPLGAVQPMQNHPHQPLNNPDRLHEGSGVGPLPASNKSQRGKLDDTEDSEDDSDDEDYDYKDGPDDAGRQTGRVVVTTERPAVVVTSSLVNSNKKPPPLPESDFYNPFRPSVTTPTTIISASKSEVVAPALVAPQATASVQVPTQAPRSPSSMNYVSPSPSPKLQTSAKNKTESDYDYEDESGDDELEETVFEDNDNDETVPSNKTSNVIPLNVPYQPPVINRISTTKPELPSPTRAPAIVPQAPTLTTPPRLEPSKPHQHPSQPPFRFPTSAGNPVTSRPSDNRPVPPTAPPHNIPETGDEGDGEEDEEEEEDEGVEEEEEEEEDPDMDDTDTGAGDLPESKAPTNNNRMPASNANGGVTAHNQNTSPSRPPPTTGQPMPPAKTQVNDQVQAIPPAMPPSSQAHRPLSQRPSTTPSIQHPVLTSTSTAPPVAPFFAVKTTTAAPILPPTSMAPNTIPSQPVAVVTQASRPTQFVPMAPSPPPSRAAPTPQVPIHFTPTTMRPHLVSSGANPARGGVPALPPSIQAPGNNGINYSNNDDSLTRQIYDKALEAYHEADKTVRATVDAVWPPNFNFDSSTLEPLLAQPVFFMRKCSKPTY